MNIIKTIKGMAAEAVMYAAATLGIGCSTMPIYDATNDVSIVRFENKKNLTDRLNCWHRIDIKSTDDPNNFEDFFAKVLPEYELGNGFSIAAQYLAIPGEDIARLGLAYERKICANKCAKFRILAPIKEGSNPEIDAIFVYNGDKCGAGILILYNTEADTIHSELTLISGKGNIRPFIKLVGDGPIDDLEGKVLVGLELKPKK